MARAEREASTLRLRPTWWRIPSLAVLLWLQGAVGCARTGFDESGESCEPGTEPTCTSEGVRRCENGSFALDPCPLGCGGAPAACLRMRASNLGSRMSLEEGSAELRVGEDAYRYWVFDTADGSITAYDGPDPAVAAAREIRPAGTGEIGGVLFRLLAQEPGSPELGAFGFGRLEVAESSHVIGVGSAALVLCARSEVEIAGELTVGADRIPSDPGPGPGGFASGKGADLPGEGPGGGAVGVEGVAGSSGGGGGSFGGPAAAGGDLWNGEEVAGGTGGELYGNAALVPLVGGSGGGSGTGSVGGDGAGAVQISAGERILVDVGGVVDAGGAGGKGGHNCRDSGGGGGAGGAILLEAPVVEIDGFVGANGGAGGQGNPCQGGGTAAEDGTHGEAARVPAPGSSTLQSGGGGGAGSDDFGAGSAGMSMEVLGGTVYAAGGGGGGGGRVRINTLTGEEAYAVGVSPAVSADLASVGTIELVSE